MKFLTTKLRDISAVTHGFFTKDSSTPDIVADFLEIDPASIVFLKQVHGNKVVTLEKPWPRDKKPEADAIVTAVPGVGIGVYTADCLPVLFAAKKQKIVGVAHAGWRGALNGVLEETVAAMVKLGAAAADITAAFGPAISQTSYEVAEDFKNPFIEQDKDNEKFFAAGKRPGHLQFDLSGYAAHRLQKAGIGAVLHTWQDTLSNEKAYFSYRRSTLAGQPLDGQQFSVIAIKPSKAKKQD